MRRMAGCVQGFESLVSDGGVLKKVIQKGLLPIKPNEQHTAVVRIRGTYEGGTNNGKVFESSDGKKSLPRIKLKKNRSLTEGLRIALLAVELGEICDVILHPPYGYGNGEVLRYHVELVDIEPDDFVFPGPFIMEPRHAFIVSQKLEIHATGYCDGKICHSRETSLLIGDTDYDGLPKVIIENLHCFGISGGWVKLCNSVEISAKERAKFGFPPTKPIWYKVEINSFENADKYQSVISLKQRADEFLRAGKSRLAENIYRYIRNNETMLGHQGSGEVLKKSALNGAIAALQNGHPDECISFLSLSPKGEKHFFRLGQAYFLKHHYQSAEKHFKKVLEIYPGNSEASEAIKLCQKKFQAKDKHFLKLMKKHGMMVLAQEVWRWQT